MICLYWIITIVMLGLPSSFLIQNFGRAQLILFILMILKHLEDELFFVALVSLYYLLIDILLPEVLPYQHIAEAVVFTCFASWLHFRTEINHLAFNKDNVLIAFYKGEKGSFKMKLYSLVGLNVKSTCIVCDDKVLRMKNGIEYVYDSTGDAVRASSDYILYDTGVKATDALKADMAKYKGIVSRENWLFSRLPTWFYSDCLEIISPLLYNIRKDLPPTNWRETFPSVYLRKCLNYG